MNTDIMNKFSRSIHKFGFKLKKHSPEILLVTGVVGGVTSAIMACKATTKASDILAEHNEKVEAVHTVMNDPQYADQYTEEDGKKDIAIVYGQTALEFIKLYGPSVLLGAASIGCILASHNIIHKRNVAISAAYTAASTGFKEYRDRVVERFGKELDKELRYNIKAQEVEETVVNEDGTESTVKRTVQVATINPESEYARFYDDGCIGWTKDPETNLLFLKHVEAQLTDKLRSEGYLYLNDAYKALGIPTTKIGAIVGWIYDESGDPIGDNFVDFGIYDMNSTPERNERKRAFVNGHERTVILDFNIDGAIHELLV
jgi:hypothetical protein